MPIRPSPTAELRKLMEALGGTDDVKREAAIARLTVIGAPAADRLVQDFPAALPHAQAAMLRVLEATADPRAVHLARATLTSDQPDTVAAAVSLLRTSAATSGDSSARDALDALIATAIDRRAPADLRIAAFDALRDLPPDIVEPVRRKLGRDPDPAVRNRVPSAAPVERDIDRTWREAVEGRLPASPEAVKIALQTFSAAVGLTDLQRLIDHIRAREAREADTATRREWRALRGAVHQALAARGSRLALYDVRDSLLDPNPLPVGFLAALEEIGDATCIEPLAAAYDASSRSGDIWWREHVASAFRAIVHREGLTRRHMVVKRAMARWPEATADLMGRA